MLFQLLRKPGPKEMRVSSDAFTYFEYGMTFVGWLPPANGQKLYTVYRVFVFMWSIVYFPFGLITSYIQDIASYTPGELLTSLQACINDVGCTTRVTLFCLSLSKYYEVKKLLNRLDEYLVDEADRRRIHLWVTRSNVIYVIFQTIYSNYSTSTFASATLNGMAPLRIYNPVIDWRSSTTNLWIASTWEYFLLFFGVMQNQLVDVFMVIYCLMLRAHLGVLRERVCEFRLDPEETEEESYENLKICLEHHKLILEYVELMRSLISRTTFIQFLLIGAILGCTLVNLFFFADFWTGLACVAYIFGVMCQTFPFCYTCDLIMDDCDRLAMAIFHSNWNGSSRRYRSALIQFLHKAQQPIVFSAGSIFSICMQTNIKVAKLAFSVVTFVKQMNIEEKLRKN